MAFSLFPTINTLNLINSVVQNYFRNLRYYYDNDNDDNDVNDNENDNENDNDNDNENDNENDNDNGNRSDKRVISITDYTDDADD